MSVFHGVWLVSRWVVKEALFAYLAGSGLAAHGGLDQQFLVELLRRDGLRDRLGFKMPIYKIVTW